MAEAARRPTGDPAPPLDDSSAGLQLYRWLERPLLGLVAVVVTVGFSQFGVVAALADIASELGGGGDGRELSITEQAGLSGTQLGIGLAVIRLASGASLPLARLADRAGRRRTLLGVVIVGLCLVGFSAFAPTYWVFVAVFAASRPFLSATNAIAGVSAAEQTTRLDRARAMALMTAAYGVGGGLFAVTRGLFAASVGFRPLFLASFALVAVVLVAARWIREPERWRRVEPLVRERPTRLRDLDRPLRTRLFPVVAITFAIAVVTGPANSFVFLYVESILGLPAAASAAMVAGAGVTGLCGLLLGRWMADRLGRRPTAAAGMLGVAIGGVVTYSGPVAAGVCGYLGAILAGSTFAPAAASQFNELFPTQVRSSLAGWTTVAGVLGAVVGLLAFGAIADTADRFDAAALLVFAPAGLCAALFSLLPETRGREMQESLAA